MRVGARPVGGLVAGGPLARVVLPGVRVGRRQPAVEVGLQPGELGLCIGEARQHAGVARLVREQHDRQHERYGDDVEGVMGRVLGAALRAPRPGAQWTGITTRIGDVLMLLGLHQIEKASKAGLVSPTDGVA